MVSLFSLQAVFHERKYPLSCALRNVDDPCSLMKRKKNQIIIQLMVISILDLIKCLYAKLGTSIPDVDVTLSIKNIQLQHRNQI